MCHYAPRVTGPASSHLLGASVILYRHVQNSWRRPSLTQDDRTRHISSDIGILEPLWFPDRSMGNVERGEDTID
jgi:hypothetical protein